METLTITLAPEIKSYLEEQAALGGATVSDHLQAMIREARDRELERLSIREKLLEAVRSGPSTPMARADWDDLRRAVHAALDEEAAGRHAEAAG